MISVLSECHTDRALSMTVSGMSFPLLFFAVKITCHIPTIEGPSSYPLLPVVAPSRCDRRRSGRQAFPHLQLAFFRLRPQETRRRLLQHVPLNLGEVPDYDRRFLDPVD